MTDAFRILPVSNDPDLEQQLRSGIVKRTNRDVLPAEVLASADVSTARVDLILGITGADIDRASRFLPEAATVAFTLADLAASLAQPRAEAIDPALLVTDVRAVPNASARSRTALIGAVSRAREGVEGGTYRDTPVDQIEALLDQAFAGLLA